jgi:hypothetical protein
MTIAPPIDPAEDNLSEIKQNSESIFALFMDAPEHKLCDSQTPPTFCIDKHRKQLQVTARFNITGSENIN